MTWFNNVENIVYSLVEYIPLVGTLYSAERAAIAYRQQDWTRHWQSVANFGESIIRDITIVGEVAEPQTIAILHTMAESLTDTLVQQYFAQEPPGVLVQSALNPARSHVIVAGSEALSQAQALNLFTGRAKGVHRFHGAVFTGTLVHPDWAPNGQEIKLRLPEGFYDNAPCQFRWKWTRDAGGNENRPEFTYGRLQITYDAAAETTKFALSSRRGFSWESWAGYNFHGTITNVNTLHVRAEIENTAEFVMNRVAGT